MLTIDVNVEAVKKILIKIMENAIYSFYVLRICFDIAKFWPKESLHKNLLEDIK